MKAISCLYSAVHLLSHLSFSLSQTTFMFTILLSLYNSQVHTWLADLSLNHHVEIDLA